MELNPNHPVTQEVHDHWHKIVAILMLKLGYKKVSITAEDIKRFPVGGAVTIRPIGDVIFLEIVSSQEAERLIKKEGGVPH